MTKNRLSKILSSAGVASRRKCEELIFKGAVQVNGQIAEKPQQQVDPKKDHILVNGQKISTHSSKVYYILNKPKGYVCSHDSELFKKKVVDLFPTKHRLFTVGRLDKETTGLIIVTNDGALSHQIIHPSFGIQKEYLVKTNFEPSPLDFEIMRSGVTIEGVHVKPTKVIKVRRNTLKVTVKEGKKHEVRKLVLQTGLEVVDLKRIRIGNLHLGSLAEGEFKQVSLSDLKKIFK